jgi:hypothetical protein
MSSMTRRRARNRAERDCYDIGGHLVRLKAGLSGWTVSVDGLEHGRVYRTQVDAWAAGVQTAEELDRHGAPLGAGPTRSLPRSGFSPEDRGSAHTA